MEQKLYPTPGQFLADNQAFLLENEALVQLNFGNASAHQAETCHPGMLFGRYQEAGEMALLFGNTLPWNICLNAPREDARSMRAAAELARYLRESNTEIKGVTARGDLSQAFREAYGGTFRTRTAMDIMVLRQLQSPPAVPGRVRKATLEDLPLVLGWLCAFSWEVLHEETTLEKQREVFGPRVESGKTYLFETPEGAVVSMATVCRDLPHGACINAVYTPPQHRGRGYCQNTVAAACREKLAQGKQYCTLFVDKKNPISNRVYEKLGFRVEEDCLDCLLAEE